MTQKNVDKTKSFTGSHNHASDDRIDALIHAKCIHHKVVITKDEIIDADSHQAQNVDFHVGKHIGDISRMSEGKTWNIIGVMGQYLKIQTSNNNGCANTRLISADAYNRPDRYPSRLPVYRYPKSAPIIDADASQVSKNAHRRTDQPEIIVAQEV